MSLNVKTRTKQDPSSNVIDFEATPKVDGKVSRNDLRGRNLRWFVAPSIVFVGLYASLTTGGSPRFITEPATRGSLTVGVAANGSAHPVTQVSIASELSGRIQKVFVDHNHVVKAGQALAELDTEKLTAALESSRAKLKSAQARQADIATLIEERSAEYERKKALANVVSGRDLQLAKYSYDRAVAQHAMALADIDIAKADLHLNEINFAKATIRSPIDGIVLQRNVEPGQFVTTSVRAPILFLIADLRHIEVRVDVSEVDIGKINIGQKVSASVSAYPERKFSAEVHDIRLGSEIGWEVAAVYKVILRIDNSEQMIRPGMTARAEIVVRQINDALLVPNAALNFPPDSGKGMAGFVQRLWPSIPSSHRPAKQDENLHRRVWILRDGAPVSAPVIVGATDGRRTEILDDGVMPGQAIVISTRTNQSLRGRETPRR
jgi:HlyD family secretion protein